MRFAGQPILISGAGRGLGEGIAKHLAAEGAVVGVADINEQTAHDVAAAIRDGGRAGACLWRRSRPAAGVLRRRGGLRSVTPGPLRAVINNASVLVYEPIEQVTEETLDRMLSAGLKSVFWGVQAFLAHRDESAPGNILNYSSPVAYRGRPNTGAYTTIKAGIAGLTKVLAGELGPRGIRVNAIAPGSVPTPATEGFVTPEQYEQRAKNIPLRRNGTPEDVAKAVGVPAFGRSGVHQRGHARHRRRHHRGGVGTMQDVMNAKFPSRLREGLGVGQCACSGAGPPPAPPASGRGVRGAGLAGTARQAARGDPRRHRARRLFRRGAEVGRGGEVVFDEAIGAEDGAGERPLKTDNVFSIFSVTKAFTNVLILKAIEEGRFALTTKVARRAARVHRRAARGRDVLPPAHPHRGHARRLDAEARHVPRPARRAVRGRRSSTSTAKFRRARGATIRRWSTTC